MADNGMDIPEVPARDLTDAEIQECVDTLRQCAVDADTLKAMEERRPWRWRNCRGLRLRMEIWPFPWDWRIGGAVGNSLYYEHEVGVFFGPIGLSIYADIGNVSSDNPLTARMGLSEVEAWERSEP
jgi:hypothetical protein